MTTQVQVRGAATATQVARTLAAREFDIDTTLGRINVHNGSTAGGVPHARWQDTQSQTWTYAAASGTDTITASLAKAPAAYAAGLKASIKIANNNTGAATLNLNSLGAVTIKKIEGGALADLEADDLVQNAVYDFTHNGTYFILGGGISGGAGGVVDSQTAAASPSLDFDSVFSAGNNYEIELVNIKPASGSVQIGTRFTDDNGATFESSNYNHVGSYQVTTTITGFTGSSSYAVLSQSIRGAADEYGISGKIWLFNPAASSTKIRYKYELAYQNVSSGNAEIMQGGGFMNATNALTGFQIIASSGNLESGMALVREYPNS